MRVRAGEDRFAAYVDYCRERLVEDPHLWAVTLFDEIGALGFGVVGIDFFGSDRHTNRRRLHLSAKLRYERVDAPGIGFG